MTTSMSPSFIIGIGVLVPAIVVLSNVVDDTCGKYDVIKHGKTQHNHCKSCLNAHPKYTKKVEDELAEILLKCALVSSAEARDKAFGMSVLDAYVISDERLPMLYCAQAISQTRGKLEIAYKMWQTGDISGAKKNATWFVKTQYYYPAILKEYGSRNVPDVLILLLEKMHTQADAASAVLSPNA